MCKVGRPLFWAGACTQWAGACLKWAGAFAIYSFPAHTLTCSASLNLILSTYFLCVLYRIGPFHRTRNIYQKCSLIHFYKKIKTPFHQTNSLVWWNDAVGAPGIDPGTFRLQADALSTELWTRVPYVCILQWRMDKDKSWGDIFRQCIKHGLRTRPGAQLIKHGAKTRRSNLQAWSY